MQAIALVIQHAIGANSDSLVNPTSLGNASFTFSVSRCPLISRTPPLLHFSSDSFVVFSVCRAEQHPPTRNFWLFIHQTYMALNIFSIPYTVWQLFQLAVIINSQRQFLQCLTNLCLLIFSSKSHFPFSLKWWNDHHANNIILEELYFSFTGSGQVRTAWKKMESGCSWSDFHRILKRNIVHALDMWIGFCALRT